MSGRKKERKVVEFRYKDKVKITAGFHRGQTGILVNRVIEQIGPQYGWVQKRFQIRLDDTGLLIWVDKDKVEKRV